MDIKIQPGPLSGAVDAPPSKSAAHRAAICAMLAPGNSTLAPVQPTGDMSATAGAAEALGAAVTQAGDSLQISGIGASLPSQAVIDCNESGSTLRFFLPIAAALGVGTLFRGQGKLPGRPLGPLVDALTGHGVKCESGHGADILRITGKLRSGVFTLPGDVSSQYITGLLFALPLLEGNSEIRLTTPLQSVGYVDMTLGALDASGIRVEPLQNGWRVPGGQSYRSAARRIEGDYSGAAFWLCAGALGGAVRVSGLDADSLQGDREILDILRRFGAGVSVTEAAVSVSPGELRGTDIDISQIPDLAPALAVVAACARGKTVIHGAARLRIKESDRIRAITEGLRALGAQVDAGEDRLIITGQETLSGGSADSFADHRIAMAMSIAAVRCCAPVTVTGAECVAKSYPNFYTHFTALGGSCHVI